MNYQCSHISDIRGDLYIFQMIDQLICPFFRAGTDSQDRTTFSMKLFLGKLMVWTGFQQRIIDRYVFQLLQCLRKLESILTDPLHTQTKCLHSDNIQIGIHRSQTASHISPDSISKLHQISKFSILFIFFHSRISLRIPREVSTVNNNSADGISTSVYIL